jgi:hypothetical protein
LFCFFGFPKGDAMRNMIAVGLIFFTLSCVVVAQEIPKVEVFAGYSLLRSSGINFNGWNGALTANLNSWAGITADFSGQYVNRVIDIGNTPVRDKMHVHNFLFGPHFAYRRERYTPFAHALFGVSRESRALSFVTPQPGAMFNTPRVAANGFMMVLGGGVDIGLTRTFALRPVQIEYGLDRFFGRNGNDLRYAAGVVFRFGRKS